MDIVSRIKQFLRINGIANSIFADTCDIPRPTVSQLLNGRNKKISNEVIDKIHIAYPNLSMMWLMFGEEPMMINGQNQTSKNFEFSKDESLFSQNNDDSEPAFSSEQDNPEHNNLQINEHKSGADRPRNSVSEALETLAKNLGKSSSSNSTYNKNEKRIVNIMVFYSDNSFESFVPNK